MQPSREHSGHSDSSLIAAAPFQQSFDGTRPWRLLGTGEIRHSSTLAYQYLDTGECVRVPNAIYNQPPSSRLRSVHHSLDQLREGVERARLRTIGACVRSTESLKEREAILEAHVEELRVAAANEGMGIYGCGLPLPDRKTMARTAATYPAIKERIDGAFDAIFTDDDVYGAYARWQSIQADGLAELQAAFFFDTSDVNSRDACRLMGLESIAEVLERCQRHQRGADSVAA